MFVSRASGGRQLVSFWVGPEIGASCALSDSITLPLSLPLAKLSPVPGWAWHLRPPNLDRKFLVATPHSSFPRCFGHCSRRYVSSRPTQFACIKGEPRTPSSQQFQVPAKKVFEGYTVTEVRAGLNATVDSSLQRVSDIVICTVRKLLSSMSISRIVDDTNNGSHVDSRTAIRSALSTPKQLLL